MNREIKFRGISKETGDFVYGGYGVLGKDTDIEKHIIVVSTLDNHPNTERFYFTDVEVEKESVGQLTGLTDKNGKEIYEGDIVIKKDEDWSVTDDWDIDDERWNQPSLKFPLKETNRDFVTLKNFGYWLNNEDFGYEGENLQIPEYYEIIGNIHENPELLCNEKKE